MLNGAVMSTARSPTLEAGRGAISRHAWKEGFDFLSEADRAEPLLPEDLERLAEAAWWTGQLAACIDARERAHRAYLDAGNHRRAGYQAIELARDYFSKREGAVARGWLNRAERLLAPEPECVETAWFARTQAVIAFEGQHNPESALVLARRALDIATRLAHRDLMALGLHDQGRILAALGRVDEGVALMDEATVAALAGELTPWTTAAIYCNTIQSCEGVADYRRAREWTEAAKRWCERQAIAGFPGMCRVYRAEIIRLRGAWAEAEREARRACDELREFNVGYAAAALYEIGEIRLRMGDFAAAEEVFRQAHELGRDPQPGLAMLRLAQGKPDAALTLITQALADETRDRLHRARFLPAAVAVASAARDRAAAAAAARELAEIARTYGTPALEASAAYAQATVALADGDPASARPYVKRSVQLWQDVDAPYETALARMLLGQTCQAAGDVENAALELEAARSAFERLGAGPDAQRAAQLLSGAAGSMPATQSEIKTFMFTDMVKSTSLVEAIGDHAWQDVLRWHDQTLRTLVARHGGEEIDHAGDGFFIAFGSVQEAIECAIDIQRTLAEHRRTQGFAPQVRIGLHATSALRRGKGFSGKGVHLAARLMAQAGPDDILVSHVSLRGVSLRAPTSEPKTLTLQGFADPVEAVSVRWRP
jgi:class 3 adenylate cyclase